MTYQEIDFIFPFIIFGYGALMTFVLNSQTLMRIAEEKFPQPLLTQMNGHRGLGVVCLVVGAIWSLQHLWQ